MKSRFVHSFHIAHSRIKLFSFYKSCLLQPGTNILNIEIMRHWVLLLTNAAVAPLAVVYPGEGHFVLIFSANGSNASENV